MGQFVVYFSLTEHLCFSATLHASCMSHYFLVWALSSPKLFELLDSAWPVRPAAEELSNLSLTASLPAPMEEIEYPPAEEPLT